MGDSDYSRGTRVYVGGLSDGVKKEDLETEFEKFGKLNNVWVAFNPPGFAFIEFSNQEDAETACDNLNGSDLMGSKLRVEIARGRGRGRGSGGFRGGRGGSRGFSQGGGGFRRGSSYGSDREGGGGYRGSRGGGRGRYGDSYGGGGGHRETGYSRDYGNRESNSYGGRNRESFGSTGGSFDSGSRFRSRSPVGRGGRY